MCIILAIKVLSKVKQRFPQFSMFGGFSAIRSVVSVVGNSIPETSISQ